MLVVIRKPGELPFGKPAMPRWWPLACTHHHEYVEMMTIIMNVRILWWLWLISKELSQEGNKVLKNQDTIYFLWRVCIKHKDWCRRRVLPSDKAQVCAMQERECKVLHFVWHCIAWCKNKPLHFVWHCLVWCKNRALRFVICMTLYGQVYYSIVLCLALHSMISWVVL